MTLMELIWQLSWQADLLKGSGDLPDHIVDKLMWTKQAKMDRYGLKKLRGAE